MTITTLPMETRLQQNIEIRDVDVKAGYTRLKGRAVPYNEDADIGWFLEQFAPGSLAKSIQEAARDLPLLLWHDNRSWPIGAADEWEDGKAGLDGIWRLDQSEPAQRAAQLVDDGMLTGMSIGFSPIRSQWTYVDDWNPDLGPGHKDRVVRQEARLIETSLVPTGAYVGAQTSWVRTGERPIKRAQEKREVDAWRAELERLRAGA